jgi:hypothetical protein
LLLLKLQFTSKSTPSWPWKMVDSPSGALHADWIRFCEQPECPTLDEIREYQARFRKNSMEKQPINHQQLFWIYKRMTQQLREFAALMDTAIPPPNYREWDHRFLKDSKDDYLQATRDLEQSFEDAVVKYGNVLKTRSTDMYDNISMPSQGSPPFNRLHHATVEDDDENHSDDAPTKAREFVESMDATLRSRESPQLDQSHNGNNGNPSDPRLKRRRDSSEDMEVNAKRIRGTLPDSIIPIKRQYTACDASETSSKKLKDSHTTLGEQAAYLPGRKLHVGNLAYQTTEHELTTFFKDFRVESVSMPMNPRTGRFVGYAFVDFVSAVEAEGARSSLNGCILLGRKLSIEFPPRIQAEERQGTARSRGSRGGKRQRNKAGKDSEETSNKKIKMDPFSPKMDEEEL